MKISIKAYGTLMFIAELLAASAAASARENSFDSALRVVDGDTLVVEESSGLTRIRLKFIDAPELRQEFGAESKSLLNDLVENCDMAGQVAAGRNSLEAGNAIAIDAPI